MQSIRERSIAVLDPHSLDMVDDEVLFYLLRDVLVQRLFPTCRVCVIDPVVLALLIDSPELARKKTTDATLRQCTREFAAALKNDALLLLPLHADNHWSLLAYRPQWRQWYCLDSMGAYHRQRALACLEALDRLKLVLGGDDARIHFYDDMPRQPGGHECARYVLFYAFVLLRNHADAAVRDSATAFAARLERELPHVRESHRPGFEAYLVRALGHQ
jgi:hypothetical protein